MKHIFKTLHFLILISLALGSGPALAECCFVETAPEMSCHGQDPSDDDDPMESDGHFCAECVTTNFTYELVCEFRTPNAQLSKAPSYNNKPAIGIMENILRPPIT
ncbi:MAG: hypothetical protein HRU19_16865 [Pseudobacteriovorax sp.]|nr:hypothetical protein [Pseudobacteriovorax sp.]